MNNEALWWLILWAAIIAAWPTIPTAWQDAALEKRFERLQDGCGRHRGPADGVDVFEGRRFEEVGTRQLREPIREAFQIGRRLVGADNAQVAKRSVAIDVHGQVDRAAVA